MVLGGNWSLEYIIGWYLVVTVQYSTRSEKGHFAFIKLREQCRFGLVSLIPDRLTNLGDFN